MGASRNWLRRNLRTLVSDDGEVDGGRTGKYVRSQARLHVSLVSWLGERSVVLDTEMTGTGNAAATGSEAVAKDSVEQLRSDGAAGTGAEVPKADSSATGTDAEILEWLKHGGLPPSYAATELQSAESDQPAYDTPGSITADSRRRGLCLMVRSL